MSAANAAQPWEYFAPKGPHFPSPGQRPRDSVPIARFSDQRPKHSSKERLALWAEQETQYMFPHPKGVALGRVSQGPSAQRTNRNGNLFPLAGFRHLGNRHRPTSSLSAPPTEPTHPSDGPESSGFAAASDVSHWSSPVPFSGRSMHRHPGWPLRRPAPEPLAEPRLTGYTQAVGRSAIAQRRRPGR